MTKRAVVLFNLGGPTDLKVVRPFLFNLFNDPYIIQLPRILRFLVAKLISWRRTPTAQGIYRERGGGDRQLFNKRPHKLWLLRNS